MLGQTGSSVLWFVGMNLYGVLLVSKLGNDTQSVIYIMRSVIYITRLII